MLKQSRKTIISVLLILSMLMSFAVMGAGREPGEELDNLALNTTGYEYPKAFADYTCPSDRLEDINDGILSAKQGAPYDEGPRNRWTNWNKTGPAYIGIEFETAQEVEKIGLYSFCDASDVPEPNNVAAEYWNGTEWVEFSGQSYEKSLYEEVTGDFKASIYLFDIKVDKTLTEKVRIRIEPPEGKSAGVCELRIFGKEKLLYGFKARVSSTINLNGEIAVKIDLETPAAEGQKFYVKIEDIREKSEINSFDIPTGLTEYEKLITLTDMAEGNIKVSVSLKEDFSEVREFNVVKEIPNEVIQSIYEEVKTPYEYGIVLRYSGAETDEFDNLRIDNPNIFSIPGDDEYVYMTYVGHNGQEYRTGLARSRDFLHWEKLGQILDHGEPGDWDGYNAAGYIVRDHEWGEVPTPHITADGKYAMTYLASETPGYEAGIKRAGVAFTDSIFNEDGTVSQWERYPDPILDAHDGTYPYEGGTIWKLQAIWDAENSRYVGFYNASGGPEVMCQAYSPDLITWEREATNPVVNQDTSPTGEVWGNTHNADADVVKIGDYWVMFYFTSSPGGIIDSFAVSSDLVHWTKSYIPLTTRNDTYSSTYAHKPCVLKKNGVVYHYYNAVGTEGRLIALDTSVDLTAIQEALAMKQEDCPSAEWYNELQTLAANAQTELRRDGGSLEAVENALNELELFMAGKNITAPEKAMINTSFSVSITTDDMIEGFKILNENNKAVSYKIISVSETAAGYVTTVEMAVGTAGDRVFNIVNADGSEIGSFGILVEKEPVELDIINVTAPETAGRYETFDVSVTVPRELLKVKFTNEAGKVIGVQNRVKNFGEGTVEYVFSISIGTPGERTITVLADKDKSSEFPYLREFNITITE